MCSNILFLVVVEHMAVEEINSNIALVGEGHAYLRDDKN